MNEFEVQKAFLKMVRQGPGYMARSSASVAWAQEWCEDHDQMLDFACKHQDDQNIYFSLATFPSRFNTRLSKFATHLCSFWADIDRHENSVYKTDLEIEEAIDSFISKTGLPPPTIWHYTGYGVHVYWPMSVALERDEWQTIATGLQTLLNAHKVGADPISADAARVLRQPLTQNFRDPSNPIKSRLDIRDRKLILVDAFAEAISKAVNALPSVPASKTASPTATEVPCTPENISKLNAMLAILDPDPVGEGGGNRPKWMRIVWSIAATGWGDDAYKIAREWSERGDLFDEADFNGVWDSYDPTWKSGTKKGTGFGTLVHYAREAGYKDPPPQPANSAPTFFTSPGKLITRPACDYEPMPVDWLVDESIPLGAMVVIAGEPGLGKSQIAIRLAAAVTTGKGLPR